ncbi:putative Transcriptional regulator, AraC family [Alteromonas alvinellae]
MKKKQSLQKAALQHLFAGYEKHGLSIKALFTELGYDAEDFEEASFRLPSEKLGKLVRLAAIKLNDETIGFFERPTKLGGVKIGVLYALRGKTLRDAYFRLFKYLMLLHDDLDVKLVESGEEANIVINIKREESDADMLVYITLMLFVFRWSSWVTNHRISLNRLNFSGKKSTYSHDLDSAFPCRHYYERPQTELSIYRSDLELPVTQKEESVTQFINSLSNLLINRMSDASITAQIKRMLRECDNLENLPLKKVADDLNKSPQTVRRYLAQENTSFAALKESVRKDIATYHLTQKDTSIKNIAYLVGFSEPSAFIRAFKKWTGLTPGEWRERQ